MANENNGNNQSWETIKNVALLISLPLSIFALLLHVSNLSIAIPTFWGVIERIFSAKRVQWLINVGNILVSVFFLFIFMSKKLSVSYRIKWGEKEHDLCELAELGAHEDKKKTLQHYETRVDTLVTQYLRIIRLFAISLMIVYLTIIFSPIQTTQLEHRYISKFALATNIFNFIEGIIVFFAFRVLYSETLNPDTNKDNHFWAIPSVLILTYCGIFIYSSWRLDWSAPQTHFLNIFDLISGSVNGLAMFLLFGRYVSLEQSLRDTDLFKNAFRDLFKPLPLFGSEKSYTKAVSFGIIFLLPFYALAQPLFGSLNIDLYGSAVNFQTTVYAICLVGKLCFLHLTYLLIREKLLHLYLYGLVSQVGNFRKLEKCLTTTPVTHN